MFKKLILLFGAAFCVTTSFSHAASVKDVSFVNDQNIKVTAKLYLPDTAYSPSPVVVLLHGCAGIFSYSDPSKGIASLYKEWAARLNSAGYAALLVDSFTARNAEQNQCGNGANGVSEVTDRPKDAYAAYNFLSKQRGIDISRVALLGWSHGGSSTMATLSDTMVKSGEQPYKSGFAFYPGCGLYSAFGGISTSTYRAYAALAIFHGDTDPLYQSGYCQQRIDNAFALGSYTLSMTAYPGAQHSFDQARSGVSPWTTYDVNAKTSADAQVMQGLLRTFGK